MGIPRLSKDIAPYAETVLLSDCAADTTAIQVTKIVIDGPSMVYHVYHALLRYRASKTDGGTDLIPSYAEINDGVQEFLLGLQTSGVSIIQIYFDGALPVSKRPIRQERLEKARKQLENYRRTHVRPDFACAAINDGSRAGAVPRGVDSIEQAIWNSSHPVLLKGYSLPAPPFMVPSAIEHLRQSEWADRVQVVPGEAESRCASSARSSHSAVLSNDSDLLLFDLGTGGIVVTLHALQKAEQISEFQGQLIKGVCFRPDLIAQRLDVPDMLSFGYHRFQAATQSTLNIAQRARQSPSPNDSDDWIALRKQYRASASYPDDECIRNEYLPLQTSLQELDPRVAEIVCSVWTAETPHMYLPILFEDPGRSSAWSYGKDIRQLAYTILSWAEALPTNHASYTSVDEYARKGHGIVKSTISLLSKDDAIQAAKQLSDVLDCCSSVSAEAIHNSQQFDSQNQDSAVELDAACCISLWYHFCAAIILDRQRASQPNSSRTSLCNLTDCGPEALMTGSVERTSTWETLHLNAATQSILYSLRILKQALAQAGPSKALEIQSVDELRDLTLRLASLPPISQLVQHRVVVHATHSNPGGGGQPKSRIASKRQAERHVPVAGERYSQVNIDTDQPDAVPDGGWRHARQRGIWDVERAGNRNIDRQVRVAAPGQTNRFAVLMAGEGVPENQDKNG